MLTAFHLNIYVSPVLFIFVLTRDRYSSVLQGHFSITTVLLLQEGRRHPEYRRNGQRAVLCNDPFPLSFCYSNLCCEPRNNQESYHYILWRWIAFPGSHFRVLAGIVLPI